MMNDCLFYEHGKERVSMTTDMADIKMTFVVGNRYFQFEFLLHCLLPVQGSLDSCDSVILVCLSALQSVTHHGRPIKYVRVCASVMPKVHRPFLKGSFL